MSQKQTQAHDVKKVIVVYVGVNHSITVELHDTTGIQAAMDRGEVITIIPLNAFDEGHNQLISMMQDSDGANGLAINSCFQQIFNAGVEHAKKLVYKALGPQD